MENKSKDEVTHDVELTREEAANALRNAGEVWSGRNAIASAWRSTKGTVHRAQDRVAESAYATDEVVRTNIYSSLGIALAAGAILGLLASRKSSRKKRNC